MTREGRPRSRLADGHARRRKGAAGAGPDVSERAGLHALPFSGLAASRDRGRGNPNDVPPEARLALRGLSQTAPPLFHGRRNVGSLRVRPRDLVLPLRRQEREKGARRLPPVLLPHARAIPARPVRRLLPKPLRGDPGGRAPRTGPASRMGPGDPAPRGRLSREFGKRERPYRPAVGTRGGRRVSTRGHGVLHAAASRDAPERLPRRVGARTV